MLEAAIVCVTDMVAGKGQEKWRESNSSHLMHIPSLRDGGCAGAGMLQISGAYGTGRGELNSYLRIVGERVDKVRGYIGIGMCPVRDRVLAGRQTKG